MTDEEMVKVYKEFWAEKVLEARANDGTVTFRTELIPLLPSGNAVVAIPSVETGGQKAVLFFHDDGVTLILEGAKFPPLNMATQGGWVWSLSVQTGKEE